MSFRISFFILCFTFRVSWAQQYPSTILSKPREKDLIDVVETIFNKPLIRRDTEQKKPGKIYFSGSPSVGYSLSSGWAALVVANGAFYTSDDKMTKLSNVYVDAVYTQKMQTILHLQSNIWTKGNNFNFVNDWRYYDYPQKTYGLGGDTDLDKYTDQTFKYLRYYQTALKSIRRNLYGGLGYALTGQRHQLGILIY